MADDMTEVDTGDDPEPVIEVDDMPASDTAFVPDLSVPNMVLECEATSEGQAFLDELGSKVIRDFDEAYDGCSAWRKRVADDWLIFCGELPKKTWPYENSANAHVPILLTNTLRIISRLSSELFDDWSNVYTVIPVGPTEEEKQEARILTIHGNWQLREQIADFPRQQERGLLMYIVTGDVTCHSFYDQSTGLNRHEMLTVDEFVTPYVNVSTMPDYSDVPFRVKILRYQRHQLQGMRGEWEHVDEVLEGKASGWDEDPDMVLLQAMAEVQGVEVPTDNDNGAYRILQYEGWVEIPGQVRDLFCQVIVDYSTKQVLKFSLHEKTNWQDQVRYDSQMTELQGFRAAQDAHAQEGHQLMQVGSRLAQAHVAGQIGPQHMIAATQQISQAMKQPPQPPQWLENPDDPNAAPEQPRMDPIHLFSHAVCIEPLAGNLGISYGRVNADHNRAADTLLSQFIDQATQSNCRTMITTEDVEFKEGLELSPGRQNKVTGMTGGDLRDKILFPDPGQANPQMVELINLVSQWSQEAAQAPDVLSGEPGKSGETYRGISTRIEQATKQLSWFGRRYANPFLRQILMNNSFLNSVYLRDEEIVSVVNQALGFPAVGQSANLKVTRKMYQRNYKIEIRSDLRFVPEEQQMGEAMQVLQLVSTNPLLQPNLALQYSAIKGVFEAMKRFDLVQILGPPPPPSPQFGPPPAPPPQPGMPPGVPPGVPPPHPPMPPNGAPKPPPNAPGPGGPVA